jgi:polar amino acid transport system substrate-binding protein
MRSSSLAWVSGLVLAACAGGAVAADGLDPILRAGTLKVCTTEALSYAMKDGSGRWIGHEIDIAERLAADLGVRASIVARSTDEIPATLAAGGCDVAAAALSIDASRLRRVWFSRPYADTEVNVVVARKSGTTTTTGDLDRAEITLAVVAGTDAAEVAHIAMPNAKLRAYADLRQARQALDSGGVAGLVHATPVPTLLVAEAHDRYALVEGPPLRRSAVAFAVRKGAADLLNFLDGWIELHQRDGYFERTDDYWLGGIDWMKRLPAAAQAAP